MRRWICIIVLLAAFSRDDYVWHADPSGPTAVEQPIDRLPYRGREVQPWTWWLL